MRPRFDLAARFIADALNFRPVQDHFDEVWVGGAFNEEVRTSGRLNNRRTLRVEHNDVFVHLTVTRDTTTEQMLDVLRLVLEAIAEEGEREADRH
jgi:hypothetical protein